MGLLTATSTCGPNGDTIVTVHATNGTIPVYINGIHTSTLTGGPGTYTAVWYNPATTELIPENVWGTKTITVEAVTECVAPVTTLPEADEGEPATTTGSPPVTTAPVGVNLPCPLPQFVPGIGWQCPPVGVNLPCALPIFDGAWVCPTTTTAPSTALDLDTTACDTESCVTATTVVPATLPQTGVENTAGLFGGGVLAIVAGVVLFRMRRHPS